MTKGYQLFWSESAKKDLKKLDKSIAKLIVLQTSKTLDNIMDPYLVLDPLKYAKKGQCKFRVGKYRVICTVHSSQCVIEAIRVGHRKDVYQK